MRFKVSFFKHNLLSSPELYYSVYFVGTRDQVEEQCIKTSGEHTSAFGHPVTYKIRKSRVQL